jgi:hypothetical protein
MRVHEAEEFFLIEVPDNVRKIVIVKAQVHEVHTTAALKMKRMCAKPKEFLKLKCLTT